MNYAQARQRQSNGRWDWTTMNDGRVWRSEPCSDHEDGHATAEEAEHHFWEYELDTARRFVVPDDQAGTLSRCLVCLSFTASHVRLADGYTTYQLCPDHHDRASLEQVHPFSPGRQLIHS
jgi:hypothetical protein